MLGTPLVSRNGKGERNAFHTEESKVEGQGTEGLDAVSPHSQERRPERAADTPDRGLDNAGKTTIVKRIMGEDVNTVSPTLGFIIKTIDYEGYKLNIWDVGGQKTLRSYWRNYFEKTDALIWVVDATDRLRIEDCRAELHGLLQEEVRPPVPHGKRNGAMLTRGAQRLSGASLLVFANKTDVQGCMTGEEMEEALRLRHIQTHQWRILRCSAMTGENLKEGLAWVVEDAKARLFLY